MQCQQCSLSRSQGFYHFPEPRKKAQVKYVVEDPLPARALTFSLSVQRSGEKDPSLYGSQVEKGCVEHAGMVMEEMTSSHI